MSLLSRIISPRYPSAAVGLSGELAAVVQLERRGGWLSVRGAAFLPLADGLVRPSFDEPNVADAPELARALTELTAGAGLARRRRWSVALPEASTRTSILTMETAPASRAEAEEMLRWKTERALGAPLDELRVSRERLQADAQGRARYLVTAVRLHVLAEYEQTFGLLGWHAGLILPRHIGEARWLMGDGPSRADSLLVSSHREGFTALVLRGDQPLYVRSVSCDAEDLADELYRFLLFYRDRNAPDADTAGEEAAAPAFAERIERLLVAGTGLDYDRASAIVAEALAAPPRQVDPADVRLSLPSGEIDFRLIAAPAGLAALAWG